MSSLAPDTSVSLRERKKQQARTNIIKVAAMLIDDLGYEQTRMRDIASAADISYQTLYNYYPGKAQILQAILTGKIEHASDELAQILQNDEFGLLKTLQLINRARMNVITKGDRELWRIVSISVYQQENTATHIYQLIDQTTHRVLIRLIHRAQESGELDSSVDAELLTDTLFGLSEICFGRFIISSEIDPQLLLDHLHAQYELIISPYLLEQP